MPSSSDAVATSGFQRAGLETLLGVKAVLLRHAAMMRSDMILAEPVGEWRVIRSPAGGY